MAALAKVGHPRTKTQLSSFLGMCNVYRRFVANYARIAAPLNQLTTKAYGDTLPESTEAQAAAFARLRDALLHPPVLALSRRGAPFTMDLDACDTQLGCALLQEQPHSQLKPVGFYSRALQPEQRNYSATEKECLGLVWAVLHLRHYVRGSRFTIRTDYECLSWIYRLTTATGRLLRWRLRLAAFDFEVKYKQGANRHLLDALSRIPTTGLDQIELDGKIPCFLLAQAARGKDAKNLSAPVPPPPIAAEELVRAQGADGRCQQLRAVIDSGKPTRFVLDEGRRLVRRQPTTDVMRVYIPEALRGRVMGLEHYPASKGHSGVQRMYAAIKRCFYWESMIVDLYDFVRQCPPCTKNRLQERRHTSPMTLFPPKEPLSEVGIAILGPLLNTVDGNRYVFVMSDRFSKLPRMVALRRITAVTVASAFLTAWVAAYGPPDCVLLDQGRQMDNSFFRAVMKMLCTRCKYTKPYHPQTNGQVKRYNRTLQNQIRAFCEEHPRQWDRLLPAVILAHNTCPHRATGTALFDLLIPAECPTSRWRV